jgi:carbon monoxide dehydrogenase subunit G
MRDLVLSRAFAALLLRVVLPLAAAVAVALWLASNVGGAGGVVLGIVVALAVLAAWFATGFSGDAARAGRPLVRIPAPVRLVLETAVLVGAVVVLAWGLDSVAPAIVLGVAAVVHVWFRIDDVRGALAPAAPAVVTAAGGTDGATPAAGTGGRPSAEELPEQWSRRGDDGSFQFGRTITVAASLQDVWRFIWDFDELALCIPGCERVEQHEAHRRYTAHVRKKLGPFLIRMPLEIEIEDHEPARSLRARVVGRDQRLRSEVVQTLDVSISGTQETCVLRAVVDVSITGVLASLDAHLIERNLDQTIGEFAEELDQRLPRGALGSAPR